MQRFVLLTLILYILVSGNFIKIIITMWLGSAKKKGKPRNSYPVLRIVYGYVSAGYDLFAAPAFIKKGRKKRGGEKTPIFIRDGDGFIVLNVTALHPFFLFANTFVRTHARMARPCYPDLGQVV